MTDKKPEWKAGEGLTIYHNQGSWASTEGCRESKEYDPVNLDLVVDRYNDSSFARALAYKGKVIHVYGGWYNFQTCIDWAQVQGKVDESVNYRDKFPLFPQVGYVGNEEFPEAILTKAKLSKLMEGIWKLKLIIKFTLTRNFIEIIVIIAMFS